MRAALVLFLGFTTMLGSPVAAQEASLRETRCWVGDVTFSASMGINGGDGIAVCQAGSGWQPAKAGTLVAGCLLEGELSSIGAVVGIRNNDSLLLQCDAAGRWTTISASSTD